MEPLHRIAIASDLPVDINTLKTTLETLGYTVVGTGTEGHSVLEMLRREKPQVLLMDVRKPMLEGWGTVKAAIALNVAVIIATEDTNLQVAREALDAGASSYMQKPYTAAQLLFSLEAGWHRAQKAALAEAENEKLREQLEVRKLVEKAKGILTEQQGFTEDEAHRCLQKMSQDQGIPLKDVCRSLIQVRMVLGKTGSRKTAMKPSHGGH